LLRSARPRRACDRVGDDPALRRRGRQLAQCHEVVGKFTGSGPHYLISPRFRFCSGTAPSITPARSGSVSHIGVLALDIPTTSHETSHDSGAAHPAWRCRIRTNAGARNAAADDCFDRLTVARPTSAMAPKEASPEPSFGDSYATASVVSPRRADGCFTPAMRKPSCSRPAASAVLLLFSTRRPTARARVDRRGSAVRACWVARIAGVALAS
jgi:hypothetical protein